VEMSSGSIRSLSTLLAEAVSVVVGDLFGSEAFDPEIRRSDFADFQSNGMMSLARSQKTNPRTLATDVASKIARGDFIRDCQVAGPGFINFVLRDQALLKQVAARLADDRLGCASVETSLKIVIDYSQPNIAKEMHVGHLRSTIIGDALARILTFRGHDVVRQNHLGDWGTQFGMLIQYMIEIDSMETRGKSANISTLNHLYREARAMFESDSEFADRSRSRVVLLQSGDPNTLSAWQEIVDESNRYFAEVYDKLDVLLTDEDTVGESYYNPMLQDVVTDMESRGIARRSHGALCVFFEDILGADNSPVPLIVQKADGGFGYATTDLAAIRHRVGELKADKILYVVDARQSLHFRMVFEAARRARYLPRDIEAIHVSFGSVLGPDGRPFKTRAGDTVRLIELLDGAISRASDTIREKPSDWEDSEIDELARAVGIGAIKYADLSTSRTRDYMFDLERMHSLVGNTGVYLQYAYARVQSLLRRAGEQDKLTQAFPDDSVLSALDDSPLSAEERMLILLLDEFESVLLTLEELYEPHRLCSYLFSLAQSFTAFYEQHSVLKAATPTSRAQRLALCALTARTLNLGMSLLGIRTPERL
jgi:arginyl-tRNA synthetase